MLGNVKYKKCKSGLDDIVIMVLLLYVVIINYM